MLTDNLDSLVAERVMGWTYDGMEKFSNPAMWRDQAYHKVRDCRDWRPSRDMACAYEVIDLLRKQPDDVQDRFVRELGTPMVTIWTTPRLICLAALAAMGKLDDHHA